MPGHPTGEPGTPSQAYRTRTPWGWIVFVALATATIATVTALLLPAVLDLVYAELVLGAAVLWPILSEPRSVTLTGEALRVRRWLGGRRSIPWTSITEVVCRPTVEEPRRIRILSGHGQVRLSRRNPGLPRVLEAIDANAPGAARMRGTWLRR
jgi:hypothetical protein